MKLCLFTTTLLLLVFGSTICVAESRYITLSVSGTNQTDEFAIKDFEVARMVSAHDPLGSFRLSVSDAQFSTQFAPSDLQGRLANDGYVPPKPILLTGAANLTLASGASASFVRQSNYSAFITFEILPETSPVDKTLIVPPGTNQVEITLESSTNLVSWATATNGIYGSPDEARFFRIHLRKLN